MLIGFINSLFANLDRSDEWHLPIFDAVLHIANIYRLPNITGGTVFILLSTIVRFRMQCMSNGNDCIRLGGTEPGALRLGLSANLLFKPPLETGTKHSTPRYANAA
jgi:hypothetical protein